MNITYRATETTPNRQRSLVEGFRGLPWWGIIAVHALCCVVGMAVCGITKNIGYPFYAILIVGSIAGVVAAELSSLFTAMVMPVFSYVVSIPLFYMLQMAAQGQKGTRTAILKIGIPIVNGVPFMLTAFGLAIALGVARIAYFGLKYGWQELWIISLITEHNSRVAQRGAAKKLERKGAPSAASASVAAEAARSATTPRPRPASTRETASIPRVSHPSPTRAGTPSGPPVPPRRYNPYQPYRHPDPRRPLQRGLTPEQAAALQMRRRQLAQRARYYQEQQRQHRAAQQGGYTAPYPAGATRSGRPYSAPQGARSRPPYPPQQQQPRAGQPQGFRAGPRGSVPRGRPPSGFQQGQRPYPGRQYLADRQQAPRRGMPPGAQRGNSGSYGQSGASAHNPRRTPPTRGNFRPRLIDENGQQHNIPPRRRPR